MKLVNLKILALLVISYSIALVAMTPLSWLMPLVEPQLNQMGVRAETVEGSLWQGRGQFSERSVGTLDIEWDVRVPAMLLLKMPVDLHLSNDNLDISGLLQISPLGLSLSSVSGFVDEQAFASVYQAYRAELTGRLQITDLQADIGWSRKLGDASGQLTWSGGPVSVPVGRSVQRYEVPTLFGEVSSDDQRWLARVSGSDDTLMLEADLTRDWIATYAVKTALAEAMDIPLLDMGENLLKRSFEVVY